MENFSDNPLWKLLVDVVHSLPLYPNHKGYTRGVLLIEKPDLNSLELSQLLDMPLGEAIVILEELKETRKV
jgi:hypothetical protein